MSKQYVCAIQKEKIKDTGAGRHIFYRERYRAIARKKCMRMRSERRRVVNRPLK